MKLPLLKSVNHAAGKHSPTILTVLSIGGLIATVALAVNETPKVLDLIEDERIVREREAISDKIIIEPMTKFEIVKLVWPIYIPAIVMGGATIASIIGANSISTKRNAALTGAYFLSETALKDYQAKVIKTIGTNKAQLIKDELAQDKVNNTKRNDNTIIMTGNGEVLCLDLISGRYLRSSFDKLKKAENEINHKLISEMWMSLNDIYGYIGLPPVNMGNSQGYDLGNDGLLEFDISTCMSDNDEPCLTFTFHATPRPRY
jgi:hypothetical protein